jgi:hypothetical protein
VTLKLSLATIISTAITGQAFSFHILMTFSEEYATVLSPFLEQYKKANNAKERKAVLQSAADAVTETSNLREEKAAELPKHLPKVCLYLIITLFLLIFMNIGHQ